MHISLGLLPEITLSTTSLNNSAISLAGVLFGAAAEREDKYRLASTTLSKNNVVETLVAKHSDDRVLVIGQYLDQLAELGQHLKS